MADRIALSGLQAQSSRLLNDSARTLSTLSAQLASGVRSFDLTDYNTTEARRILDLRAEVSSHESYSLSINLVQPRLEAYSKSLQNLREIAQSALTSANQVQGATQASSIALDTQVDSMILSLQNVLNQRVGDRFIFSGRRYNQVPVGDIGALPVPPTETHPATSPTLPPYDAEAIAGTPTNAEAYVRTSTSIDDGLSVTYGVTSAENGIQDLVRGLRFMKAALNNPSNYTAHMKSAASLLTSAVSEIRTLEGRVTQNQTTLQNKEDSHKQLVSDLKGNLGDIRSVDVTEVGTKITFFQTQLQASYSVTARLSSLTLLTYL